MNRFWIILAVVVLALVGIFLATKPKDETRDNNSDPSKITEVDHSKWNDQASVTLIEYGDFQCPGCGSYYSILKELEESHGDEVHFIFRHFPLRTIHPNAQSAALAAEAAGRQGKFWEMHDKLFETQTAWGQITTNQQALFEGYAKELDLDLEKFQSDYRDPETAKRINNDLATGKAAGISGTPSFLLNGKLIDTPANAEAFGEVLDEAIKKAKESEE